MVFKITFEHDLGESYHLIVKDNKEIAERSARWIAEGRMNCKLKSVEELSIEQQILYLMDTYQGKKFMDTPDEWYEPPHWWCENSHRSERYLKSEALGYNACLAGGCRLPVMLGPKELLGREPL